MQPQDQALDNSNQQHSEQNTVLNNAKSKSYPFSFTGTGKEFFGIWIVNVLLTIVTLSLYTPWAKVKTLRYFYGHTYLDSHSFKYLADPWKIFKGRMLALAVFIVVYIGLILIPVVGQIVFFVLILFLTPWLINRSLRFNAVNSAYRNIRFDFKGSYWDAFMVFVIWPVLSVLTVYILSPFWLQRLQRYVIGNSYYGQTQFHFDASVSQFYGLFGKVILLSLAFSILGYGAYFVVGEIAVAIVGVPAYIYLQAYIAISMANILYANSRLRTDRFVSNMQPIPFALVIVKNMVFLVLTLGLYYPWAKVNLANYRADTLELNASDLEDFIAGEKVNVSAFGDELGEAFDVDISVI